tara:strand:+ start:310 stop:960 length:651 start_codon:yes stop_codon:yes gene_type:complete
MKMKHNLLNTKFRSSKGFSLIEVVLAIGIFSLAVLALVGLMGPMMKSASTVQETAEASGITDRVNNFLQAQVRTSSTAFGDFYTNSVSSGDTFYEVTFPVAGSGTATILEKQIADSSGGSTIDTDRDGTVDANLVTVVTGQSEGSLFRITVNVNDSVQDTTAGGFNISNEAHMAIQVDIDAGPARVNLNASPWNIVKGAANDPWEPVISYTTAVLR